MRKVRSALQSSLSRLASLPEKKRRLEELTLKREEIESDLKMLEGSNALSVAEYMLHVGKALEQAAREWHAPPGEPKTAANLELLSMNVCRLAYVHHAVRARFDGRPVETVDPDGTVHLTERLTEAEVEFVFRRVSREIPAFDRVMNLSSDFYNRFESPEDEERIADFHEKWFTSSFARLEVGHKLAAALALTDVPDDVDVRAPWAAWSLVIPDGLLPDILDNPQGHPNGQIARVWLLGSEPVFGVTKYGDVVRVSVAATPEGERILQVVKNLVRGACLCLSNPEDFRKERVSPKGSPHSPSKRSAPPDLAQARFLLSAPVKLDLRQHLRDHLSGEKRGGSPTVQFLVRGHWRNQAHGPRHTLRKVIWVPPFWKGDEEARVLLRTYEVSKD